MIIADLLRLGCDCAATLSFIQTFVQSHAATVIFDSRNRNFSQWTAPGPAPMIAANI